ncbi:uncharacterized protein EI90DRAFT_3091102 [Cantharellus anzutake]|uniref:uncharacterized protein n=1 Tax=Cantharellus anzutake TaxID=1750568 RepID=UPI001906961D|nr:uncharacterized protein EI90DRAFT_3091102 [Cantharellus anzutake]KAF8313964.1 hypothetical protein EI90DRAFT_3091102 [Cantharellus anzutake]
MSATTSTATGICTFIPDSSVKDPGACSGSGIAALHSHNGGPLHSHEHGHSYSHGDPFDPIEHGHTHEHLEHAGEVTTSVFCAFFCTISKVARQLNACFLPPVASYYISAAYGRIHVF